nr:uncharacterized protein LOC117989061 [Maniola hyperantus]
MTIVPRNCFSQILGFHSSDKTATCDVENNLDDSPDCMNSYSSTPVVSGSRLGQISIEPFILRLQCDRPDSYTINHAVPNIVFREIKWKRLKFRIEKLGSRPANRLCSNLFISDNMKLDDRTVLHYDCYKSLTDGSYNGMTHVLDLEATDGTVVDRRKFLFYIPSARMLSPNSDETHWKPFVYVENLVTTMQLRIVPPPALLNFTYQVQVKKTCVDCTDELVENITVKSYNSDGEEVSYDYTPSTLGSYYFVVTTLHDQCTSGEVECQSVKSPAVPLAVKPNMLTTYIIVTGSLIAVSLLVYLIYRRYCRGASEMPKPTKVLVIYPPANSVHSECVASFVAYLRSEYGFDISYDGDIPATTHCDPYFWAEDVIKQATHIMYIVGPKDNENYPHSVLQNVDKLLLSFLKAIRAIQSKEVVNVFFEHSNGPVPNETRNDRVFYLLRDWQKLIAYLSRDLLPKKQIMRTDKGKCLIENLTRMKKSLNEPYVV